MSKETKYMAPKFKAIKMSLFEEKNGKTFHPEINGKDTYLVLIDGCYHIGRFNLVWYGYSFHSGMLSMQLDPPGKNGSRWQQIWKVTSAKPKGVRRKADKCPKCKKGTLKVLKTTDGDPEGLRSDRECRKCGTLFGCTKANLYEM